MAKRKFRLTAITTATIALLLGGCSDRGDYPSLARRPAEDVYATARPAQTPPPPQIGMTPGLAGKLSALMATARAAHETFVSLQPAATRAVSAAAGAAKGTEAWSVASVAVAGLESARSQVGLPLANLDRLEVEASKLVADGAEDDFKAVRATRAQVDALASSETAVISGLLGRLGG